MQSTTDSIVPVELVEKLQKTINDLKDSNPNFENAYDTYTLEYGKEKLTFLNDPLNITNTVDPVAIAVGRNCVFFYSDSSRSIHGAMGSVQLGPGEVCIIGRRQPQDSKLVVWSSSGGENDIQEYNSRASILPSRIHGAIVDLGDKGVYFCDLGSSSGTVLVGENTMGPFVRVYDPERYLPVRIERISTGKKA